MITEEQLREVLKRHTDEETQPLGDEVPVPEIGRCDRPWDEWREWAQWWIQGVHYRRAGMRWDTVEGDDRGTADGWLAQQMEWLRWQHRDDNICPTCFGMPIATDEGPLILREPWPDQSYCGNGHAWHWCPAHRVKVAGEYDFERRLACTCEKEAES